MQKFVLAKNLGELAVIYLEQRGVELVVRMTFPKFLKIVLIIFSLNFAWMSVIIPVRYVAAVSAASDSQIPRASVYMSPFRVEGSAGSTVTVDLRISNVTNLYAFQAGFLFDPAMVNATQSSFTEGGFLSNNGADQVLWFRGNVDNVQGYAQPSAGVILGQTLTRNGSGTLMHVAFRMKATGFSDIHIVGLELLTNDIDSKIPSNTIDYSTAIVDGNEYITRVIGNPYYSGVVSNKSPGFSNYTFAHVTQDIGGTVYNWRLNFTVTSQGVGPDFGPYDLFAYFNVTIPNNLMWGTIPSGWALLKDNVQQSTQKFTEDATHTTISFQFTYNQLPQVFSIYSTNNTKVPDDTPPAINSIGLQPTAPYPYVPSSIPRQEEPVAIKADVTEEVNGSGIDFVQLWFSINSGTFEFIPMVSNASVWVATIPAQVALTQVDFYVVAQDFSENTATSSTHSYVVEALVAGDINADGIVNIFDAALIGTYWLKTVPPVPALVDINRDGIIDISDAAIIGAHWLWHGRTDQFNINAVDFHGTAGAANNSIKMTIENIGTSPFTISTSAKVNGAIKAATYAAPSTSLTIAAGAVGNILIQNAGWNNGQQYSLELMTITGTKITYVAVAPNA